MLHETQRDTGNWFHAQCTRQQLEGAVNNGMDPKRQQANKGCGNREPPVEIEAMSEKEREKERHEKRDQGDKDRNRQLPIPLAPPARFQAFLVQHY